MRVLVVEDCMERMELFNVIFANDKMDHAHTAALGIELLSKFEYDLVMLDHDLSDTHMADHRNMEAEGTGQDVARWMAQMTDPPPFAFIHSWNPAGAQAIARILRHAGIGHHAAQFNTSFLGNALDEYRRKFEERSAS